MLSDVSIKAKVEAKNNLEHTFKNYDPFFELPIDKIEEEHKFLWETLNLIKKVALDNIFSSECFQSFLDFYMDDVLHIDKTERKKYREIILYCFFANDDAGTSARLREIFFSMYFYLYKKHINGQKTKEKILKIGPTAFNFMVLLFLDKYLDASYSKDEKQSYLCFLLNSGYITVITQKIKETEEQNQTRQKRSNAGKASGKARRKKKDEAFKIWRENELNKLQVQYALPYYKDFMTQYNISEETIKNSWFPEFRRQDNKFD